MPARSKGAGTSSRRTAQSAFEQFLKVAGFDLSDCKYEGYNNGRTFYFLDKEIARYTSMGHRCFWYCFTREGNLHDFGAGE